MKISRIITTLGTACCAAVLLFASCGGDDDQPTIKDTENPVIALHKETDSPLNCDVYHLGDKIYFDYTFTDDIELGSYVLEIHPNFDHHTHANEKIECEPDPKKEDTNGWKKSWNGTIPKGSKEFHAKMELEIPSNIETGDYHFMIRLTDQAGHQQLKGIAIKIK
jgi:hypothetical protein